VGAKWAMPRSIRDRRASTASCVAVRAAIPTFVNNWEPIASTQAKATRSTGTGYVAPEEVALAGEADRGEPGHDVGHGDRRGFDDALGDLGLEGFDPRADVMICHECGGPSAMVIAAFSMTRWVIAGLGALRRAATSTFLNNWEASMIFTEVPLPVVVSAE
jgi:hypothetical protein